MSAGFLSIIVAVIATLLVIDIACYARLRLDETRRRPAQALRAVRHAHGRWTPDLPSRR
jgi:hypothetical protein